ncbi:hypothetical protein [Streptomyces europaeiscabiei]|uniref:Integral membrane protein n=1 Tax=Streptomyces europaeiscabiei TaxID=146819 RepID=A0ABU4NHK9_9ACTN|nr:hypothetical protein [Streptomyces europaeiscabiei]MDX3543841.1 hypothetical protein [Streptomyces europaeiscabiei]MDX3553322.1 hypothetical protein [Streptomyces europaeiscabiei]MDX3701774.1 hypothetical protein [Streptomyces europaeiscabiei]MDX3859363.1 hypothetical protein [Streptomyces europaeiscabiei]MDX3868481.1 hypothetical protein [Streptomyces europaeiscabiei]
MAVFGIRAWWRELRTAPASSAGATPRVPPERTEPEEPAEPGDSALKAYAVQHPEGAEPLIQVESARVADAARPLSVRLLLGTACGSVLLFSVSVATRVGPGIRPGGASPLTSAVIGAVGAALVTALGAWLGGALRHRSTGSRTATVSGDAALGAEPGRAPGSGPGAVP